MARSIGISPRARVEVVDLATYIGKDSVDAASRFLDASEATFNFLRDTPQAGAVYPTKNARLAGLRVSRVQGFPNHLVLYLERLNGIEIVRVVHGARDIEAALEGE